MYNSILRYGKISDVLDIYNDSYYPTPLASLSLCHHIVDWQPPQWVWEGSPMALGDFPRGFGRVPQWLWEGSPMALGGFPNGFGEVCCQATEFYTLSSGSFGDEDSKSQCMPVANHKHAI